MLLGIITAIACSVGIFGALSGNFVLLYIAFGIYILEHGIGYATGTLHPHSPFYYLGLIAFIVISIIKGSNFISIVRVFAFLCCIMEIISFVIGLVMTYFIGKNLK